MSDLSRQFKGVWIPADVWLDHSLSITEKVMMVEIGSLQDPVRGCYASNSHFAEFFGLSNSRVSEIISGLADRGLVRVELIRDGRKVVERRIRVVEVFGKHVEPPSENTANLFGKGGDPYSEKAQGSNTKNNNTNEGKPVAEKSAKGGSGKSAKFDPLTAKPANVSAQVWADWCQHRKEIKKALTSTSCARQAAALSKHHDPDAVINHSISNGWTGLFPESVLPGSPKAATGHHSGFSDKDYTAGLKQRDDGSYAL